VNAQTNPRAGEIVRNADGIRVVLFVNGAEEWRGSFAGFLMVNTFDQKEVNEMARAICRGDSYESGGGAAPTFKLVREDAKPDEKRVYSLCEAVADLSASFIVMPKVPADSREMTRLCIEWAQEFEKIHGGREWDGEYIETIDAFFADKYDAWIAAAADVRETDFIPTSPKDGKEPRIYIALTESSDGVRAYVPTAIGNAVKVEFLDLDENVPDHYYESHGVPSPRQQAEMLDGNDTDYRRVDA
jgi:hypothetical protein